MAPNVSQHPDSANNNSHLPSLNTPAMPSARHHWTEKGKLGVLIAVAAYCVGFFVFYPSVISVADESYYIREAVAISKGGLTVVSADPLTGADLRERPSDYPIGTSMIMAGFTRLVGWKGAFLVPLISFVSVIFFLCKWLTFAERSPAYALAFFFFPPALVMGRVAMSDMLSTALIAVALWLFWTGNARPGRWISAGLIAGASVMVRETNPMVLVPFVAGALLRREPNRWYLASALAVGVATRFVVFRLVFGNALFTKTTHASFELSTIPRNMLSGFVFAEVLILGLVLVALAYRGQRRPELLASLVFFLLVYLSYGYSGEQSGRLKGAILGGRFYLPLIPVSIFAAAEVFQKLAFQMQNFRSRFAAAFRWNSAWLRWLFVVIACGNSLAAHAAIDKWSSSQGLIAQRIYHDTPNKAVVITNLEATRKFFNEFYGERQILGANSFGSRQAQTLIQRNQAFYLIILDRFDSPFWSELSSENQSLVDTLSQEFCLLLVTNIEASRVERLRIWKVVAPNEACAKAATSGKTDDENQSVYKNPLGQVREAISSLLKRNST